MAVTKPNEKNMNVSALIAVMLVRSADEGFILFVFYESVNCKPAGITQFRHLLIY